ncbi:TadG family pilus assembly protein [Fodinicurvata sp. EGI_FJ10296]|uniref:TadG family pilus assembly protein n=1 Tax=Fodinicurvata sp. EGI_FJ10296 TaxID=3231908 RepID=UPI003451A19E
MRLQVRIPLNCLSQLRRNVARSTKNGFLADDKGVVAVLFAIVVPVALGFGAVAIDGSNLYVNRNLLQTSADAAARAGVAHLPDGTDARAAALYYGERNMPTDRYGTVVSTEDVVIGIWNAEARRFEPTANGNGNAIRVTARRQVPLFLARIWGTGWTDVDASAIAALVAEPGNFCVLALGTQAENIAFQGGNQLIVDAPGCSAASNSTAESSMRVTGQPSNVTFQSFHAVGGAIESDLEKINLLEPARLNRGRAFADPYADFDVPTGLTYRTVPSQQGNQSVTMQPGIYSDPVSFRGNFDVVLDSGVYVFDSGFDLGGSVTVTGSDVTIIVRGDVDIAEDLTFPGNVTVNLVAPSEGGTAGLALVGLGNVDIRMQGNPNVNIDGAVYTPQGNIHFAGNPGSAGCLNLIGNSVSMIGSASFANNCESSGTSPIMTTRAALVN